MAGKGIPSNRAMLKNGKLEFIEYTQNKPHNLVPAPHVAAERLRNGERILVDMRHEYQIALRELLQASM